jgi:hypothetical protein
MDITDKKERYRLGLQWWGTEIRRTEDPKYWVKKMREWIEQCTADVITITDVRFTNEAEMIRELGGIIVRVYRPNQDADTHSSESNVDNIRADYTISNSSTLEGLDRAVSNAWKLWGVPPVEPIPTSPSPQNTVLVNAARCSACGEWAEDCKCPSTPPPLDQAEPDVNAWMAEIAARPDLAPPPPEKPEPCPNCAQLEARLLAGHSKKQTW